jgi:hypothetical protein
VAPRRGDPRARPYAPSSGQAGSPPPARYVSGATSPRPPTTADPEPPGTYVPDLLARMAPVEEPGRAQRAFRAAVHPGYGTQSPRWAARAAASARPALDRVGPVRPTGQVPSTEVVRAPRSRVVAGVLGIFLGATGAHRLYTGRTRSGLAMLVATVASGGLLVPITATVGMVEGVMFLASTRGVYSRDGYGRDLRG